MRLNYNSKGLVPAVVQDINTREVLMVAYMNKEAFDKTVETKKATFWSRSRKELWVKGETSGNRLEVVQIRVDCDEDCVLLLVKPTGPACHTGNRSCFYRVLEDDNLTENTCPDYLYDSMQLEQKTIAERKHHPQVGSYTNYLFDKGEDKIVKKVGEEAAEVLIAAKNRNRDEIKYEVADLIYHLTVMLVDNNMTWEDIYEEMERRRD